MKRKVKIALAAVIAAGVTAAAAWSSLRPMEVTAVTVEPREAYAYFIEDGTVMEGTDFMLYPEVSGAVLEVTRKKGDFVNAGEIILRVDSSEYRRQYSLHEASINGYMAQIESAKESEQNAKDEYQAAIAALRAQLSQIEAEQKSAEAARISAPTANEQLELLSVAIDKTKTDVALSEENVSKLALLYENGAVSKAKLDEAENALEASNALLRQYETEYAQASGKTGAGSLAEAGEAELFAARRRSVNEQLAALERNLQKDYSGATEAYYQALIDAEKEALKGAAEQIEKCEVKSPVNGYITDIPAESLSAVSPLSLAAVIKTEGDTKVESYVSTKDIAAVGEGDEVTLVLKGRDADREFSGAVESVSKWAEAKSTALGLEEKKVRVIISAGGEELLPGADVDVKYTVFREQGKILVPISAVFSSGGSDYVFTVSEGRAVKTAIVKGVKTLTETVAESGLKSGDTVISEANTEGLAEGTRVKAR